LHLQNRDISRSIKAAAVPWTLSPEPSDLSPVRKRLEELSTEISGNTTNERNYLHVVMAQIGLPYSDPKELPFYQRSNGNVSLALTSGVLKNPQTGKLEMQGIPYGAKARLLVIHVCTEAVQRQSPTIPIEDSMSAFMRKGLNMKVTGGKKGSISLFKEQLNRLAASRIQLFDRGTTFNPAPMIAQYDVWFPKDSEQRILWPSSVDLSKEFFESLLAAALPLDPRAVTALQSSALALDIYTWLTHRLCRIPSRQPVLVSWMALQVQFGSEYGFGNLRSFQQAFRKTLARVLSVYRDARVQEISSHGLELRQSPPPVAKTRSRAG
jgi:Plasmid encoded RepA protein